MILKKGTKIRVKNPPPNKDGWVFPMNKTQGEFGIVRQTTTIIPGLRNTGGGMDIDLSFDKLSWCYYQDQVELVMPEEIKPPKIPSIVIANGEIKNE